MTLYVMKVKQACEGEPYLLKDKLLGGVSR